MIKKIRVNISISNDMYEKIKQYDLSLSLFVEIRLREYFTLIEKPNQYQNTIYTQETHNQQQQPQNVTTKTFLQQEECGRRDLNPSFKLGKLK